MTKTLVLLMLSLAVLVGGLSMPAAKTDSILVLMVNFQDRQLEPLSVADVQNQLLINNAYYFEQSYGLQSFTTSDVFGWYTMPISAVGCDQNAIATNAEQIAATAGINTANYNHVVYFFPGQDCPWSGNANLGGQHIWLNSYFDLSAIAHELGHNLGLYHSHFLDCGDVTLSESGCISNEYGDRFDIMGASNYAHFNLFQKERAGWVVPQLVNASGTYWIDAYETTTGIKGLKIPKDSLGNYYYVEHRTAIGYDSQLTQFPNVLNGVLIHLGTPATGNVYTLDMHPTSLSGDLYDPALDVGETFTYGNFSINVLSADNTGAMVQITTVPMATPTPTPTPMQYITATITANPTYKIGDYVTGVATITDGTNRVSGASVSFAVVDPNGNISNFGGSTDANGVSFIQFPLLNKSKLGTYTIRIVATKNNLTANASTTFVVTRK